VARLALGDRQLEFMVTMCFRVVGAIVARWMYQELVNSVGEGATIRMSLRKQAWFVAYISISNPVSTEDRF